MGMPWVSQTPLGSRQVFKVARNEEQSQDKPHACAAKERICMALPWEVGPYVFIYTQPNRTEQTLPKVLTDICLWDKGEHDNGVNNSLSQEGKERSTKSKLFPTLCDRYRSCPISPRVLRNLSGICHKVQSSSSSVMK